MNETTEFTGSFSAFHFFLDYTDESSCYREMLYIFKYIYTASYEFAECKMTTAPEVLTDPSDNIRGIIGPECTNGEEQSQKVKGQKHSLKRGRWMVATQKMGSSPLC